MPIDLHRLPGKMAVPGDPPLGRWSLLAVTGSLLLSGTIALLWPEGRWHPSPWFWCAVVVFPLLGAFVTLAMALLSRERHGEFVTSWNRNQVRHADRLISEGQVPIALMAAAYRTPAGGEQLAQALRAGTRAMRPCRAATDVATAYLGLLEPCAVDFSEAAYAQRLLALLQPAVRSLDLLIGSLPNGKPLAIRIRHDGTLSDEGMAALWRSVKCPHVACLEPVFANPADGLMWIDKWLDAPDPEAWVLSLEINLFTQPVPSHTESVSAVLLARASSVAKHPLTPMAWIHRPVIVGDSARGLDDALLWGHVQQAVPAPFVWHSQVDPLRLRHLMTGPGPYLVALDPMCCQGLDDSFGRPGAAVGHVAMIIAAEQAVADQQPQLVLLQDSHLQACIVRAA